MRFILAFALLPAFAIAEPYEGRWAQQTSWCQATDDRMPFEIVGDEIRGYEGTCTIADQTDLGVGRSWRWTLKCSAEGTEFREDQLAMLTPGDDLIRVRSSGHMTTYKRCP